MPAESPPAEGSTPKSAATKPRASAKPRVGIQRKTKAEREEYARKEAERAAERDVKDATPIAKTPAPRGRGSARGGRGGAVVNRTERTSAPVSYGVFGAGTGERLSRTKAAVDVGISEALDAGEPATQTKAIAKEPRESTTVVEVEGPTKTKASGRGKAPKQEAEEFIQVEEDPDEQPRRDIERIWISSDENEDEEAIATRKGKQRHVSKTPKQFTSLRPLRATRTLVEEHEEEAKLAPAKKSIAGDNNVIDVESDDMQIDGVPPVNKKDVPSSPELSKKSLKKVDSRTKDPRIATETVEERAERLRLQDDIEQLKQSFVQKSDTEETIDSKEEDAVFGRTDHDRMFLFQLPPLVPALYDPAKREAPEDDAMEVDPVQVKVEDAAAAAAAENASAEIAQKDVEKDKKVAQPTRTVYTADAGLDHRFPQGLVGKLHIHKSGKVSLDWGGTDMEVRYGTEVDFLQDVVCVEDENSAMKEEIDKSMLGGTSKAYAMGQVNRKMVLVPDWSRLYA